MPKQVDVKTRQITLKFDVQDNPQHQELYAKLDEACKAVALTLPDFALLCAHWGFEAANAKAAERYARIKAIGNLAWGEADETPVKVEAKAAPGKRLPATKGASTCKDCAAAIPAGTPAWWYQDDKTMQCEACHAKAAA
jgi:hypothetical protein